MFLGFSSSFKSETAFESTLLGVEDLDQYSDYGDSDSDDESYYTAEEGDYSSDDEERDYGLPFDEVSAYLDEFYPPQEFDLESEGHGVEDDAITDGALAESRNCYCVQCHPMTIVVAAGKSTFVSAPCAVAMNKENLPPQRPDQNSPAVPIPPSALSPKEKEKEKDRNFKGAVTSRVFSPLDNALPHPIRDPNWKEPPRHQYIFTVPPLHSSYPWESYDDLPRANSPSPPRSPQLSPMLSLPPPSRMSLEFILNPLPTPNVKHVLVAEAKEADFKSTGTSLSLVFCEPSFGSLTRQNTYDFAPDFSNDLMRYSLSQSHGSQET